MEEEIVEDEWLGSLHSFPAVLHARASLSFDLSPESLQKVLVSALLSLRDSPLSRRITVADRDGYSDALARFKVGVGNGDGFDILDSKEKERVLRRIENRGAFKVLDLAFHIQYKIEDKGKHRVHQDHYMIRLVFQPGRLEALLHHLKGIRRLDASELLGLIVNRLNAELTSGSFPQVSLDQVSSS